MTHMQNSTNLSRKKRLAIGAVSVLTAGALFGLGAQGASAAPLAATGGSASATSGTHSNDNPVPPGDHALVSSMKKQIRADLSEGNDPGEKAQNVATTISENPAVLATLPPNLQADLASLKAASVADRTAVAENIKIIALSGGYGEQIQGLGEKLQHKVDMHAMPGAHAKADAEVTH